MSKGISAEKIAEQHYSDVYKFCCSRCRDSQVAQDITQETFLTFMQKKESLTDINICAWLINVANNKLHEWYRKRSIEFNYVSIYDVNVSSADQLVLDEPLEEEEEFDAIQQKIMNILNEHEKELFIKLYVERKSVSLIQEELGVTNEAFRARKSRMNRKIKASIGHLCFFVLVMSFKLFHSMP